MIDQNITLVKTSLWQSSICAFALCIWDDLINIGLYVEVCIIFMEISIFWQVSLFQFLLPGQFVVSEAPGMKCPSIAINEKVALVFNKPKISYSSTLKKKYCLPLAKIQ